MSLQTFRIGDPARTGDALRIATTRRPPRGIRKADWPEYFDVYCEDESRCHRSILRRLIEQSALPS
jgi:uncharacterized protein YeaO (DUF488 family)